MKRSGRFRIFISYIMKHPENRVQVPVVAAALAIFTGIFLFFWMPEFFYISGMANRIKALEENIKKVSSDRQAAVLYTGLSDESAWIEKRISTGAGEGDILMNVNSIARQAGMKLSVENAAKENEPPAGYEVGSQSLVLTGSYGGLRRFIYNLETMDVLTVLRKARVERTGKEPGNIKAWIELVYYKRIRTKAGVK